MDSLTKKRQKYLSFILLWLLVYFLVGFYPFEFKTISIRQLNNGAISTPEQGLHFRSPGIAYTEEAPSWLPHAIDASSLEISLEVRSADQKQGGPARIFTLSLDTTLRNLTIGQQGSDLIVRMRHRYTNLNGTPSYKINEVFTDQDWHEIDILITSNILEIRVDGDTNARVLMPNRPLEYWDPGYRIALGNELSGDRPWLGGIRRAIVRIDADSFNYLAPDALKIPETFTVGKDRVIKLVPFVSNPYYRASLVDWEINLLFFVPFGWLLVMYRRSRQGVILAAILSACVSAVVETTQLLFLVDRFPSSEDLILNTLGGAIGAWLAGHFDFSVRRRPT